MPSHGGRILAASRSYGRPAEQWLDLSTGISPWSWLAESGYLPSLESWQRLPQDEDGLEDAASDYYGSAALPVAGSQAAIQMLPRLRPNAVVGILNPTYSEHAQAWSEAGHRVLRLVGDDIEEKLAALDVLVLCNPNNPDGRRIPATTLLDWQTQLAARGGWLIVDEAFADAEPALSVSGEGGREGLIVLRSLGKFFGLAGARVGFVLCPDALRASLREALGPWSVAGPSRDVAKRALRDCDWHSRQSARLWHAATRLQHLLCEYGLKPSGGCVLFQQVRTDDARRLFDALANQGILVRRFREPDSLRFGLPRDEDGWQRLEQALARSMRLAA